MKKEVLSFSDVCRILSITAATGKNWIRLGKIRPIDADSREPVFARPEIERLLAAVEAGDKVLKSRRNKKKLSGTSLYENYITNRHNISVINEILELDQVYIDDDIMRIIIANFALQLICGQHGNDGAGKEGKPGKPGKPVRPGKLVRSGNLIREYLNNDLEVYRFKPLIDDLLFGAADDGMCQAGQYMDTHLSERHREMVLSDQYSDILDMELEYVPEEDCLGFVYISLKNMSQRKVRGAYYTPLSVVKELVGLVRGTVDLAGRRIIDPCCGTGNFLLYLASQSVEPECLYGQDSDEFAVRIARINFALRFNITDMGFLKKHITCGDTLKTVPFPSYDIILGNPPWGYDFTMEELAELTAVYRSASLKIAESYDLFVERCLSLLSEGGLLAFVLPEAILNVRSHRDIRDILLEKSEFRFVSYLGNVFSNVHCPSIILGVSGTKGKGACTKGISGGIRICTGGQTFTISPDRKFTPDTFNFHVSDEKQSCLDEICKNTDLAYLKGNARFALGIVTGNNKAFVSETPRDGYEPVLRGSDIYKYRISDSHAWMRFVPESFQQVAPAEIYRAPEKLLYRFICDMPVFAYDNRQRLSLNSCNILIPEIPGLAVKYVLAIMNSGTVAFFCRQNFNSVKVLRSHLEAIPIPVVPDKVQQEITSMVDRIMELASKVSIRGLSSRADIIEPSPKAGIMEPSPKASIMEISSKSSSMKSTSKVSILYDELDNCIMELYGLSAKHRDIIRESLKGRNRFLPPDNFM
jgi:predicted RNA methylase